MNVKVESLPHSQSLVTVEVEAERMAQAKEDAFRRIARDVIIPGFRKGKAPRNLAERYIRPETVEDDAETHVVDQVWSELRSDQFKDASVFAAPQVKVAQHNPFTFQITLTHEPSVQLGDYKSIRVAPELVTVSAADVNEMLDKLREEQAQWQPVEHRPVRQGDLVTVKAHGLLAKQPIVVPEGFSLAIDEKATWLVPGFATRLIGMEIDQEKEFAVQVPGDAEDKEAAGTTTTAYVTVTEIKEKILPSLDDSLAKTLGAETVADLTEKVRSSMLKAREEAARDQLKGRVLDEIAAVSTVSFPQVMTDQQVENMISERNEYLRQRGLDMSLYLQITQSTMDKMRADLRPDAEKRIRNYLLIEELGRAEGIMTEDSAVNAEIERVAAQRADRDAARRELSTNAMHERIRNNLHIKAIFDRLIAIVTEGQEPVALSAGIPDVTDSVATEGEAEAKPKKSRAKKSKRDEEKPKLIVATH